jgi:hypothetical protein
MQFVPTIPSNPLDLLTDLGGVFFYPQGETISVFALTPIFLVFVVLAGILLFFRRIQFSPDEKKFIILAALASIAVFLAYASQIHSLNTDPGITPDVRYLSPMYLPLTIIGLIILKHVNVLPEDPVDSLKKMMMICIIGLPFFLILINIIYSATTQLSDFSISKFFSLYTLGLVILTLGTILYSSYRNRGEIICQYLILLLCSIPLFWQVTTIFYLRSFSSFAGYTFWIPVVRVLWEFIVNFIILKNWIP